MKPNFDEILSVIERSPNRTWISLDVAQVKAWIEYTKKLEAGGQGTAKNGSAESGWPYPIPQGEI